MGPRKSISRSCRAINTSFVLNSPPTQGRLPRILQLQVTARRVFLHSCIWRFPFQTCLCVCFYFINLTVQEGEGLSGGCFCLHSCLCAMPKEAKGGCQILWNQSFRWLWAAMWLLATTPQSVQEQVLLTAVPSPQPYHAVLFILYHHSSPQLSYSSFTDPGTGSRKFQSFTDPGSLLAWPLPLSLSPFKSKQWKKRVLELWVELSGCCLQTGLRVYFQQELQLYNHCMPWRQKWDGHHLERLSAGNQRHRHYSEERRGHDLE